MHNPGIHPAAARNILIGCLAIAFFLITAARPPAGHAGQEMDLDAAIKMALEYSPSIRAGQEDIMAAQAGKKEAFNQFLPTASASYNWVHADETPYARTSQGFFQTGTQDTYQFTTSVSQPIFTGFKVSTQYALAKLGVDISSLELELTFLELAYKVKEAYFTRLSASKALTVARESVRLLEAQLKISQDFYNEGLIPRNDVLKVKVNLAKSQQDLVETESRVANSRANLNKLLGLPIRHELPIKDILDYKHWPISFNQALGQASSHRPELRMANVRIEQAKKNITLAQGDYWPGLNLVGEYKMASDAYNMENSEFHDTSAWQITTNLSWTFWEWGSTRQRVSQKRAAWRKQKALKKDLADQVELEVNRAYLAMVDSERKINTAQMQVRQAEENYRITNDRYKEQLTTNTELLDAQTLLTQSRNSYLRALAEFNIAKAGLLRAMGRGLPQSQENNSALVGTVGNGGRATIMLDQVAE